MNNGKRSRTRTVDGVELMSTEAVIGVFEGLHGDRRGIKAACMFHGVRFAELPHDGKPLRIGRCEDEDAPERIGYYVASDVRTVVRLMDAIEGAGGIPALLDALDAGRKAMAELDAIRATPERPEDGGPSEDAIRRIAGETVRAMVRPECLVGASVPTVATATAGRRPAAPVVAPSPKSLFSDWDPALANGKTGNALF